MKCCAVILLYVLRNTVPGSSVGIATDYELDGPGIESRWGEIFRTCPDRSWGPPSLLYNRYQFFPGSKIRPGVLLTTHPILVPGSWKSRAIPLPTCWATPRPVTGTLYFLTLSLPRNTTTGLRWNVDFLWIRMVMGLNLGQQTAPPKVFFFCAFPSLP